MPDGTTFRDQVLLIYRKTGELPDELSHELPESLEHLWFWFLELNAARDDSPISYTELKAWAELTDRVITADEVAILKKLDWIVLNGRRNASSKS